MKKERPITQKEDLPIIFALAIKQDCALLSFFPLYPAFYHWKMMALHHSSTQQSATAAVNHNKFISTINSTQNMCLCGGVRVCVCVFWLTYLFFQPGTFFKKEEHCYISSLNLYRSDRCLGEQLDGDDWCAFKWLLALRCTLKVWSAESKSVVRRNFTTEP